MQIRLYLDEDTMDADLVEALRIRGVDVTTAKEAGMIRRMDDEHLMFAAAAGRALYSFNIRDYQALHAWYLAQQHGHAGIILAQQQRYSLGEQMRRLLKIIAAIPAEQMCDNVVFLSAWG